MDKWEGNNIQGLDESNIIQSIIESLGELDILTTEIKNIVAELTIWNLNKHDKADMLASTKSLIESILEIQSTILQNDFNIDFNTKIIDLWFSTRINNRLKYGKIYTLWKLLTFRESELLKIISFWEKQLSEINENLNELGLYLWMSEEILITNWYKPEK